jgi:hypothetical protein
MLNELKSQEAPSHFIINLLKTSDKDILKAGRQGAHSPQKKR